ncbi:MAG: ATP-dependent DNA helicase RecG [Firmicutes bacterium ADurb.Bin467]|nr:MAG: ATP-dependent DNA helicase RecG [Firmicutes bacterium ADurb.Bin467]
MTPAQAHVWSEIARDLNRPIPMNRLLQGDVGSGKTAVAFGAIYLAWKSGFQSAMMAPTEVLAQQHFSGARELFEPLGMKVGLLTGSLSKKQHEAAHRALAAGEWDAVFGTHALITEGVEYANLGLVVTDEQHRFGVRQRTAFGKKGGRPNVLVMSATPIPRTLSLILYGDLDLSILDELPPGRTPVKTRIVPEEKRKDMFGFVRREVRKGRQAYVICPLVAESEAVEAKSAEELFEELKELLPDLRLSLVHGRMKSKDKDAALEKFRAGETDVLVSTTVVEVGVNVPNASTMVVENAERFGLAQLHQLRGRVGRGPYESWCFLVAEPSERLTLLTRTADGFKIAEKDMELRGPGELFGERQSGMLATGLTALAGDTQLLKLTHDEARRLLKSPEAAESRAVAALARRVFQERLDAVALN